MNKSRHTASLRPSCACALSWAGILVWRLLFCAGELLGKLYYHNFLLLQSDCACVLRRELKDTAPPDLLKRDFHSDGSRRQVVEDITYLPVMESRLGGGTRGIIIHSDAGSTYRRCGKSTLLKMYRDSLLASGIEDSRTIFINFEDYDNRELLEPENLASRTEGR
ncbi:MAG: hypothetical protein SPD11_13375 [Sphaerochaetaceae bacterium]|nr:hypothetical protein [Sphaerochaetaceae bacterium]